MKKDIHTCEFCGHQSNFRHNLIKHIKRLHNNVQDLKCKICKEEFSSKKEYQQHFQSHVDKNEVETFKCSICEKIFLEEKSLKQHVSDIMNQKKVIVNFVEKVLQVSRY